MYADLDIRRWTEAMLKVEDWLCDGEGFRDRFCGILQGRSAS